MDGLNIATDKMLASVENGVGTMTYNHPERRNAVNHEMRLAIIEILSNFAQNSDVRVIVVTGNGRAWCAGLDVAAASSGEGIGGDVLDYGGTDEGLQTEGERLGLVHERPVVEHGEELSARVRACQWRDGPARQFHAAP